MLKIIISLFLSGLALGSGPCLVSCGPLLISYIAATKTDFKAGLLVYLIFSFSRISVYLVLGFLTGVFSQEIIHKIFGQGSLIFFLIGLFILLLGLLIILGIQPNLRLCKLWEEKFIKKDTKSIVTLGILYGVAPCFPLLGILSYVILISKSPLISSFYMFCFGMGTIVSPLFLLSVLAGTVPRLLIRQQKMFYLFRILCGLIIVALGLQILCRFINR